MLTMLIFPSRKFMALEYLTDVNESSYSFVFDGSSSILMSTKHVDISTFPRRRSETCDQNEKFCFLTPNNTGGHFTSLSRVMKGIFYNKVQLYNLRG